MIINFKLVVVILLTVVTLLLSGTQAKAEWTKADTLLVTLRVIDYLQTRDIATRKVVETIEINPGETIKFDLGYKFSEANPILGEHPSVKNVTIYFATLLIADYLIAKYGSDRLHKAWLAIEVIPEIYCVTNNYVYGVKFKF